MSKREMTVEYLRAMVKKSFANVDIDEGCKMCVLPFQSLVDTVDLYEDKLAGQEVEIQQLTEKKAELQKQADEYKAKIEQGTLKEMNYPCNVGDKVFVVRSATSNNKNFYIFEDTVLQLCVDKNREVNTFWLFITFYQHASVFEWNFDKVFLTREEAEKRLKELQE